MVFTIGGTLRAGYEPRRDFVSVLSLGPRGWVQMTNFILLGVLLLIIILSGKKHRPCFSSKPRRKGSPRR
jgi:hypothetical protein